MAEIVVTAAATLAAPILQLVAEKKIFNGGQLSLDDVHEVLNKGLKYLLALQSDKDKEVSRNLIHKDPSESYEIWKQDVSNIQGKVTSLNNQYVQVNKKRRRIGNESQLKEKIEKALNEVIKHVEKCSALEILVDKPLERVIKEIGVPSIAEYETLNMAFEEIQAMLQIEGVKCVVLRGHKGGGGKTTIMRNLNNHFYDSPDFDVVIFIKVPPADKEIEKRHIMQKIAGRLKVPDGKDIESDEVARGMQKVLENKRYLLILDGVRRPHTLDHIWSMLGISEDKRDSKVVIATEYPLVTKLKCVNGSVKLKQLEDTEALQMFQGIVGNDLPPMAKQICKRFCCRLPLLIDPIAKSFKYQEYPIDWQKAFDESTCCFQVGVEGLEELYPYLQSLCLERFHDKGQQKYCFLYASLYPANSKIWTKYLAECWIAQGFLHDVDPNAKYSEMRRRAIDITLTYLVNIAFLEEEDGTRYVKMNDFYREFALYILSKDSDSKYKPHVDKEEHDGHSSKPESWKDVKWVSMIQGKRESLATKQDCERLQTLLLQESMNLVTIPHDYFERMGELLVLNLYGTKINKLPSLEGLSKLKALYLNGCCELKIESPNEIKSLEHLEIFDIRDTRVNFVPYLKSLRCLRISYHDSSNYHRIQELHKLEELTIEVKSLQQWVTNAKLIIEKVDSLKNLTTCSCRFPSKETKEQFLKWKHEKQLPDSKFSWEVKAPNINSLTNEFQRCM